MMTEMISLIVAVDRSGMLAVFFLLLNQLSLEIGSGIRDGGRSYVVETDGGTYLRNRRFIKAAACRVRQEEAVALKTTTSKGASKQKKPQEEKEKKVSFKFAVRFK